MQRALALSPPNMLPLMLKRVRECLGELKQCQIGKRIYTKLVKTYPELSKR